MDVKYIAGFFDGDGHASISWSGSASLKLEVGFCNNYRPILEEIRCYFHNYGKIYFIKPKLRRQKESFRYKIWRMREVKEILEEMLPYLRIKKRQAELILEFINLRLAHGYIRTPYTSSELEIFAQLQNEHKKLGGERIYGRKCGRK